MVGASGNSFSSAYGPPRLTYPAAATSASGDAPLPNLDAAPALDALDGACEADILPFALDVADCCSAQPVLAPSSPVPMPAQPAFPKPPFLSPPSPSGDRRCQLLVICSLPSSKLIPSLDRLFVDGCILLGHCHIHVSLASLPLRSMFAPFAGRVEAMCCVSATVQSWMRRWARLCEQSRRHHRPWRVGQGLAARGCLFRLCCAGSSRRLWWGRAGRRRACPAGQRRAEGHADAAGRP